MTLDKKTGEIQPLSEDQVKRAEGMAGKRVAGQIYKGFETIVGKALDKKVQFDPVVGSMASTQKKGQSESDLKALASMLEKSGLAPAAPAPAPKAAP